MVNQDQLLEQKLSALEMGSDLENVLAGLPDENEELAGLIRLAAAVRALPHPEPSLEQSQARQADLTTAANRLAHESAGHLSPEITRPNGRETLPAGRAGQKPVQNSAPFSLKWLLAPAAAGAVVLFFLVFFALLGVGLWLSGPRNAQVARLVDVSGEVAASAAKDNAWRPLTSGDRVRSGERIRTSAASTATLVFFDGSRTTLEPNTDLVLSRVDGDWGKVLRVVLTQTAGHTQHTVVPAHSERSAFTIFTPAGEASVQGTVFSVAVEAGVSRFAVEKGRVLVTNDRSQVFLNPGQVVASGPGELLEPPAYQFALQGQLTGIQGSTWSVAGVPFTVAEGSEVAGHPLVSQIVRVEGRILPGGDWVADSLVPVADSLAPAAGSAGRLTFTSPLQAMGEAELQVSGFTLKLDGETKLAEGLTLGRAVRVVFTTLEEGRWQALEIEPLEGIDEQLTPSPTPDPNADPSLSFEPDELETASCETSFDLTGTLINTASEADDYAAAVELGYAVTRGAEYVDAVQLDPVTWETIAPGEQVDFNIHVALDAAGWGNAPAGTEIKVRVFVAYEANRSEGHDTRLTVTIAKACEGSPTPTGTITTTPTITGTITETPTITATPGPIDCTGANPHPTGMKLAQRYGVPYEEIMGWFCQRFGFGEIDHAYSLSRQFGLPVADIFALRRSGMGWGQIRKYLENLPTGTPGLTGTPSMTPNASTTPQPSGTPAYCTGANPHPTGQRLAIQYGVPYAEIMGWFCQGFGFGEIDLAYSLSLESGTPVIQIFDMRRSGMGWGEIRQALLGGLGIGNGNGNGNSNGNSNGNRNGKGHKKGK